MKPLVAAAFLLLALPTGHAQAAIDCKKPENLTELQSCWKMQDAHRVIALFRAAGESSGYWKCLIDQFTLAGKQAEAAKNPIDTSDEYNRVIIGAQVTCEPTSAPSRPTSTKKPATKAITTMSETLTT
jgi:hypothetical protein